MKGYLIRFYVEESEKYQGKTIYEWLLAISKQLGLRGATVNNGIESLDHDGKRHSAHFFELADRPVQIEFAVDEAQEKLLFEQLSREEISIFYTKTPIEFGVVGTKERNND